MSRELSDEKRLTMVILRSRSRALSLCLVLAAGVSAPGAGCSVYDSSLLGSGGDAAPQGGRVESVGGGDPQSAGTGGSASSSGSGSGSVTGGKSGTSGTSGSSGGSSTAGQNEGGAAGQGEGEAGAPDQTSAGTGSGGAPVVSLGLRHRYSFSGGSVDVVDSVTHADGKVVNGKLDGSGLLNLTGVAPEPYVDLPNGMLSELTNATLEVWFTWSGTGGAWQRVFDFGSSDAGEDNQGTGVTYLFLSPKSSSSRTNGTIRTTSTNGEIILADALATAAQVAVVALVVDDDHDVITMYRDGAFRASAVFSGHLSEIQDVNNWLGRSQFKDAAYVGTIDELRIYGTAVSASALAQSFSNGPDAAIAP